MDQISPTNKKPSVIFITRSYPPATGGMEKFSYELTSSLSTRTKTLVIANKRGFYFIPLFIFISFFRALWKINQFDTIHIGDPVLSFVGFLLKKLARKPVIIEVHGLDIVWDSKIYQWYLQKFFKKFDLYICISSHVENLLKSKFGVINTKVIPPGINDVYFKSLPPDSNSFRNINLENKNILLTVGRLIKRKGVSWFVENVIPKLPANTLFLIAGDGSEKDNIQKIIDIKKLNQQVFLLGKVTNEELGFLYNRSNIFIMPNISIPNDAEGFGLVTLEAASCGLPVIASQIEGITEAIKNGENGILVESKNTNAFVKEINSFLANKDAAKSFGLKARLFTLENFSWPIISQKYLDAFKEIKK